MCDISDIRNGVVECFLLQGRYTALAGSLLLTGANYRHCPTGQAVLLVCLQHLSPFRLTKIAVDGVYVVMMKRFCDAFCDIGKLAAFSASRSDIRTDFASYEATSGFLTQLGGIRHTIE
jgi:hypothetical protein